MRMTMRVSRLDQLAYLKDLLLNTPRNNLRLKSI